MKINTYIKNLLLLSVIFTLSCVKEKEPIPTAKIAILGENHVKANTEYTYSTFLFEGVTTYTWTVPNGATILSGNTTSRVKVKFGQLLGDIGEITVAVNDRIGKLALTIDTVAITVNVVPLDTIFVLNSKDTSKVKVDTTFYLKPIKMGDTKTVKLKFNCDLDTIPTVMLDPSVAGIADAAISPLTRVKDDSSAFTFELTAGAGNAIPLLSITSARTIKAMGSVGLKDKIDGIKLNPIDNKPSKAKATFNSPTDSIVKDGTPVIITVTLDEITLNEPILNQDTKKVETDSILVTIDGKNFGMKPSKNALQWTYIYTPNSSDNKTLNISISNILADRAGNPTAIPAALELEVDNTAPVLTAPSADMLGEKVVLTATSSEDGNIYYLDLPDSITKAPVEGDFASFFAGKKEVAAKSEYIVLKKGKYKIYFMPADKAGNVGAISAAYPLTVE